jgi:hypothetical protein
MLKKPFTLEHTLYALALILALGLRFFHLERLPLTDYEADYALQSLALIRGADMAMLPNAAYIHLTAVLFAIFGATDFWARFLPALCGALLVLAPWFVRGRIGRLPALLLAFGLALDPGLNAISRLAGGPMLAVAFLSFALVLWLDQRRAAAAVFAALALLSGPSFWLAIVGLLLAWVVFRVLPVRWRGEAGAAWGGIPFAELKPALYWGLGTLLVVGTLLLLSLQGLSALISSLLAFLSSWWELSGLPLGRVFLALPAYELLPLAFGLTALVRGLIKRDGASILLSLWMLAGLVLVAVRVGHQVTDLVWALLPLWTLAAMELGRHLDLEKGNRWVVGAVVTFTFVLLVLAWLTLAKLTLADPASAEARLQWVFIGGILLVTAISLVLVGSGWTPDDARLGGVWGFCLPLLLFTLAMTTGAAGVREPRTLELWNPEPRLGRADLVLKVANDLSILNKGMKAELPLTIAGVDSSALEWMFHDWDVEVTDLISPVETPELMITPLVSDLGLTAEYRGEPLVWREMGDWYAATFANWVNWFVYRQMPVQREDIILWVRSDLMLEALEETTTP